MECNYELKQDIFELENILDDFLEQGDLTDNTARAYRSHLRALHQEMPPLSLDMLLDQPGYVITHIRECGKTVNW